MANRKNKIDNNKSAVSVHNFSSQGQATRHKGDKTERIHHSHSRLERKYLHVIEFSKAVTDYKDNYPLEIEETLQIADQLGVKHNSINGEFKELTTDFFLEVTRGSEIIKLARAVKQLDNFTKRVCEKFDIESEYWKKRSIDFKIITDKELKTAFVNNIEKLHKWREWKINASQEEIYHVLRKNFETTDQLVANALNDISLRENISLSVLRPALCYFIWHQKIQCDLNRNLDFDRSYFTYHIEFT